MFKKINYLFVTMIGLGSFSRIPGSIASLATTVILFIFFNFFNFSPNVILFFIILIFFISIYAINKFIEGKENKDPKEVVIDELIGQSIPICLYEVAHTQPKEVNEVLTTYFLMFILFRVFDITKPYPVSYYDKNFKNGFGVIMDDVCAGLYVVGILVFYMVITS